jgi:hypothetical protein
MSGSPWIQPAQAITDANGFCTFVWPPPPSGGVATGTVSVTTAPTSNGTPITWILYLGVAPIVGSDSVPGTPIISTQGGTGIAGVQQTANNYIVLQASGLSPGTIYNATFAAVVTAEQDTDYIAPTNTAQSMSSLPTDTAYTVPVTLNSAETGGYEQIAIEIDSGYSQIELLSALFASLTMSTFNGDSTTFGWYLTTGASYSSDSYGVLIDSGTTASFGANPSNPQQLPAINANFDTYIPANTPIYFQLIATNAGTGFTIYANTSTITLVHTP